MRLGRVEVDGAVSNAVLEGDLVRLLGADDPGALIEAAMAREVGPGVDVVPVSRCRFLAPIARPPSIRDFMTFHDHVRDARGGEPVDASWFERPTFYFSNPHSIFGPGDDVPRPSRTRALDYEVEVACVIGQPLRNTDPEDPVVMHAVAGFTIMNDWSARDLQSNDMRQGLGPGKGKDFATSLGPVIVTPDEFQGAMSGRARATMIARVDDVEWSRGQLGDMEFDWPAVLAAASADADVAVGDVLGSGACGGGSILEFRARGRRADRPWLAAGQVVELEVEGLGVLRNRIAAPR